MQRNSGMPACASCKHQRKKCSEKCVLAPYFPANKNREFQAVHKLFGVSNVTKVLRSLDEEDRKNAIDSLVWEAYCRQKDPVLGPYGEYRKLYEEFKLYRSQHEHGQVQTQGGMVYKPAPGVIGWNNNNNNGICNNKGMSMGGGANIHNGLNYIHNNNGNSMVDSTPYSYSSDQLMQGLERMRQEGDVAPLFVVPQQHSVNSLNRQYYLSG